MDILQGNKTYIVAGIMILLAIAKGQGWITAETYVEVNGVLVALGFSFLRAGGKADAAIATEQAITLAKECKDERF
jgi:hypothetical protein